MVTQRARSQALIDEHREGLTVLHAALEGRVTTAAHPRGMRATLPESTDAQRRPRDYWWHRVLLSVETGLEPFMLTDISTGARL